MELKQYPRVLIDKRSDGSDGTCCLDRSCCFMPLVREKNIQSDSLTRVEGLDEDLMHENILVDLRKECRCKGKIISDKKLGKMIQLEGDRKEQVERFLSRVGLARH